MYWPLAKASFFVRVVGPEQGVRLDQDDPQQGLGDRFPEALAPHLGQEAGQRRVVRAGVFEDDRQAVGLVAGVGVDEPEPLAPGLPGGDVEGVGLAGPAGGQVLDRDQADPGVGLGDGPGDLGGPVGAPVVDDEDLEVRVRLGPDRGQAVGEGLLLVLGRDDRRDQGRVGPVEPGGARAEVVELRQGPGSGRGGGSARWR